MTYRNKYAQGTPSSRRLNGEKGKQMLWRRRRRQREEKEQAKKDLLRVKTSHAFRTFLRVCLTGKERSWCAWIVMARSLNVMEYQGWYFLGDRKPARALSL